MLARLAQLVCLAGLLLGAVSCDSAQPAIVLVCAVSDGSVLVEKRRFMTLSALKAKADEIKIRSPRPQIDMHCEVTEARLVVADKADPARSDGFSKTQIEKAKQLIHDAGLDAN